MTLLIVSISVSQILFLQLQKLKKKCHEASVIHVTHPMLCPVQIVVSDIVDVSCNKFIVIEK